MSSHEHRYSFPDHQREQRQQKQGLRWSMDIAVSKSCSTPVSISSRARSGLAGTAPQILTQARTTTLTSGEVGMAAISSQLGKGKSTGQSVSSMRLSRQFSTHSGHPQFTPTCSLAASAAKVPRVSMNNAGDSDAKSTGFRFTSVDSPRPVSSFDSSSLPSLSSLSSLASCSSTSSSASTSASTSVPTSTLVPEPPKLPAQPVSHTRQCAPLSITLSSSVSCSGSSSSPISPISSHTSHHQYSLVPAAFLHESPSECESNHRQKQKHKQHKVRQHHTSRSSAPLSPPPSHPTLSPCPCSPHSPQQRPAHHPCHVCSRCYHIDKQEQGRLASEIPSTKGTPSPTNAVSILCRTPAGKQQPAVPIDPPFLIQTSRSLTFLPSPSLSSALNISPVECHSLSPTTASPAEALYLASRPIRASSIESFKRKSSSFFSSLTPSSSASSLSSFPSPTPQATADASAPYRSPDYLTAYFAETTRPPRANAFPSVPPSQCPAQAPATPAHPSSRSAVVARHDRYRPLTVVSTRHHNPFLHPTPASTPESLESDKSSPGVQDSPLSSSNSSLPGQDRWSFYSGSYTTGSLRQHTRYSSSHTPTSNTYTYSAGSRYHPRRNIASSSLYQPIMSPLKAKHLSFITTEQPKHGPARSTQSTLAGGDWGELTTAGLAAGVGSGQDQQATHGAEPNSATSGQDPWMVVTGSGSSYASNSAAAASLSSSGLPPSSSTPLGVREEQLNRLPPLQLLDRHEDSDPVLDPEVAHQIRLELPRKLRNATRWNLVYSSDQHGISMTTLYHRCKGKGPMVLAIKDSVDAVFGAFVTEEFKPNLTYYGTGECFLWNVTTLATSPQPPPSPAFAPSPLPSPSPFQLSSAVTTPIPGRSPSPSTHVSGNSGGRDSSNNSGRGGDRRHDLFMAMNDRLSTTVVPGNNGSSNNSIGGLRSPSPLTYAPQPHLASSPSSSPTLRPVVSPSSVQPRPASFTGRRKKKQKVVQFWKWTGKNDYMILSEPGFIGLGGGDGKFGLWIHSDLERGHSACCATFDNEPLAAVCHQPVRLEDPQQQQQQRGSGSAGRMVNVDRDKAVAGDNSRSDSRSSSPKDDREEFFCQTVEIWAMVL